MDSNKKPEKRYKCDECPSAFTTKSNLKNHKSGVHSELRPFQCEHCEYSAKFKGTLEKHYRTHFPQRYKTQMCPYCPYKCSELAELQTHLRVHTKEKPLACNMCSYRASFRTCLAAHTRTHTGEKPFKCSLCTFTFSHSSHLKRHKLFVHNRNKVSLVACSFPGCDRKFTNKYAARKHVESIHNKEKRFSCPYCEKVFYAKFSCVSHIRHRHTTERSYKRDVCEYVPARSSDVKKHESNTHGKDKAAECPVCHRKYKNDQRLGKHQRNAQSNAEGSQKSIQKWKYKETGCTKEFQALSGLKQHANSFHLQQRQFKCFYCDHTTATSSMLNIHLRTHTQEKPHSCSQCRQGFTTTGELSAHKATAHSDLRPFQCNLCMYSANTKAYLKKHKKIHEQNQTNFFFECNICKESRGSQKRTNYSFRTKRDLSFHTRKTHCNEGSFKWPGPPPGTKSAAVPNTAARRIKGFHTTEDCPPCFVRLVKKTELKRDSLCKTLITIYA